MTQASSSTNLRAKYGKDLSTEFKVSPELLGGLRIKVGSDVFDGSVRERLNRLEDELLTPKRYNLPFTLNTHFSMSSILQELETQIGGLKTSTSKSNVGVVREVGDGVAKIEGLSDVMLNEMIEFPGGLYGLALNLEESEVGAILLGDGADVTEGTEVKTTGRLLSVPVGKGLLGRVVDALGNPVDGKGPINADGDLSRGKNRARHHQAQIREPAGADRHHGHRRDDSRSAAASAS